MVAKLLASLVAVVVGLALLPIVQDFVSGLTGVGMAFAGTTTGALIDLIPILYVLTIVGGTIAYVVISMRNKAE